MQRALMVTAAILSLGCSREHAGNASASAYTADSDSSAKASGIEGTNSGAEFEAPRLIPAMQNQLNLMASGSQPADPNNLTAYKNLAGDLVNSMASDLARVGAADSGKFRVLKDSVMDELGGGAGTPASLDRSKLPGHISRMRRLISLYQTTVGGAAK
jgi:hypothetical protein